MKPTIALTVGDYNGIGPEVALKAALHSSVRKLCQPVLVGPLAVFQETASRLRVRATLEKTSLSVFKPGVVPVVDIGDGIGADISFGTVAKGAGKNAGAAIEHAVQLCLNRRVKAMVTAPVSKEALHLAGYTFPGQTEMVTMFSRGQRVAMVLIAKSLRVGLVTIHTPLKSVSGQISAEKILEKLTIAHSMLTGDLGIKKPRIAVLALNPHAGEHGVIGTEDDEIVAPAVKQAVAAGIPAEGPFPADAFFGTQRHTGYDLILAMYHDQGLIPLKMSSFGQGVNYSAGLSIIRTSPDHGTAFDIAGTGKAQPGSMVEAVRLAVTIAHHRERS